MSGKQFLLQEAAFFSKRYGKAWSPLIELEGLDPFYTLKRFAFWVPKEITAFWKSEMHFSLHKNNFKNPNTSFFWLKLR